MADKKISQLTAAAALTGSEPIPTVQGGVTVQTTAQAIADLAAGGGGSPAGSNNQIQINQSGAFFADSTFQKSDTDFNVGLDHTTQSPVTFTGSGLDDLTLAGTFSGTYPTTYTVTVAGTGTPDTFDWTDGTNSGTGVSMSTSPITLSNGIEISFGVDTGHTLSDSWTWTYSIVNQNVLDFSNNDYKFQSTIGDDTFSYQIGDNLFGMGLKGSLNIWQKGSNLGFSGFNYFGGNFGLSNWLVIGGGNIYGTQISSERIDIGSLQGGNGTSISIDDVNEHITISNLPAYDDDTAAGVGGLTAGMVYMTTGSGSAPLNTAGILMIKQ